MMVLPPSHPQYGSGASPVVPSSIIGYRRVVAYNPIQFSETGFSAPVTPGGTDWIDAVTRSAPVTNASFSIANGSDSARYYFGLGYLDRQGVMNYTGFKRINLKFNSEAKIKDRIKVGQHINLSYSNTIPGVDESIEGALRITPLLPVKDSDGNYTGVAGPSLSNTRNPAAQLYRSRNDYFKRFNLIGDVYISYDVTDSLTAKTTIAGALNTFDSRQFTSLYPEHGEPISTQTLNEQNQTKYNWNWTSTLNYNTNFGDHSINALVGIEAVKESDKGLGVTRQGYLFEDPTFYLLNNGSGAPNVSYAYDGYSTLFSVFGTANYNVGEYTQAWTDQTTARRAVRYETRLETAMEGNRFFDLQRWGVQRDVLNDYLARESKYRVYLQGKQFSSPKNEFYPIPTYAIERSFKNGEPTLTQDPNY
ncbi:MAG: RagB/SusD family nutrient uptake outer membrane protein [Flavobacteriaceae bacterium]